MSWWTDFRDAALTGAGLKKGRNAARTLSTVARPQYRSAVKTLAPPVQPVPQAPNRSNKSKVGSGFSIGQYFRDNKSLVAVLVAGGGFMLYKGKGMK